MKCPNCNDEGGSGKFCRNCGSPLIQPTKIVCAGCGSEILSTAKFCAKCGTRVASAEAAPVHSCTKCNAPLQSGAKFCKSCGQPRAAAPRLEVVPSAAVPSPSPTAASAPAPAPLAATQMMSIPASMSSVASAPQPRYAPPEPTIPRPNPIRLDTAPVQVDPTPVQPEFEPAPGPATSKKPIIWLGGILAVAAIAALTWWFGFRTPAVNNAPIVKGPLYDQPAQR